MRETNTHIYFWGSYLSNFYYPAIFQLIIENVPCQFYTSEQAFMAFKALEFNDRDSFNKILNVPEGKGQKVKALGRKIQNFDKNIWDKVSYKYMFKSCLAKFSQNEEIRQQLLGTGTKILVEASPFDKIWGVGLAEDNDLILDEQNWDGENRLGSVLMNVRLRIQSY